MIANKKFKTFDIETTDTEPWRADARIVSMQMYDGVDKTFVDIHDRDWDKKIIPIIDELKNPDVKIIIHNAVFEDYWMFVKYGFHITNVEDTLILPFVLDKGASFEYLQGGGPTASQVNNRRKLGAVGLKKLGPYYTGVSMSAAEIIKSLGIQKNPGIVRCITALYKDLFTPLDEVFPKKKKVLQENNINTRQELFDFFYKYSLDDVLIPYEMWKIFREWAPFPECYHTEIKLIPHLVELMTTGMCIDQKKLDTLDTDLVKKMKDSTNEMRKMTGNPEFMPSERERYADALEARGHTLPRTEKGRRGTGKKYLAEIDDELVTQMNIYNKAKARKSQNIDGIRGQTDKQGIYHPSYISCGTVHGRMASRSFEIG